jgi:hypothetical protein
MPYVTVGEEKDSRAMPPSTSTMSLPDAGTVRWRSK